MLQRTVVFPIHITEEQQVWLEETTRLYTKAWQRCVDVAWNMKRPSSVGVHNQTYQSLKSELGLKSQYLCSARNKAVESVKSAKALAKKGKKVKKPQGDAIPIRLDSRTLSFDKVREQASVTTQHGRLKVPLFWHSHAKRYRSWDCRAGEIGKRFGKWVLRLVFQRQTEITPPTGKAIGIDRGIRHPVVSSDNRFLGQPEWKEHERKLLSLRSKLQSKGTKSAKRHLKKLSGRLRRFKTDCDRQVAKHLVSGLMAGDTIVLEDLTDIRDRIGKKGQTGKPQRARISRWTFRRLEQAVTCVAQACGVYIEKVDPKYTSQKCSACGCIVKSNRKRQALYECVCGLSLNADLNAARNIETLWRSANSVSSGLPVNQPIVGVQSHCSTHKPSTLVEGR